MSHDFSIEEKHLQRLYTKLDTYQKHFYDSIQSHLFTAVDAKAGTGKSFISVLAGLTLFLTGKISKIYYIRIPDDRSLRLGYLPGTEEDKQSIYSAPFYDALETCGLQPEYIESLIMENSIKILTDISMRGINIENSYVIIDEAQNGRLSDLKLILTRISDNSKCVFIGHSKQYDNYKGKNDNAFGRYIEHMTKKDWAIQCELKKNYRGKLSQWADELE